MKEVPTTRTELRLKQPITEIHLLFVLKVKMKNQLQRTTLRFTVRDVCDHVISPSHLRLSSQSPLHLVGQQLPLQLIILQLGPVQSQLLLR